MRSKDDPRGGGHSSGGYGGGSDEHAMHREPMRMMAREHYGPFRWVQAPISALALWLVASPFTLGYSSRGKRGATS